MYDDKPKFTRLTLEQGDQKVVWEVPYEDVNGEDMVQALKTVMIGMTFYESSFYNALANYLEEYAGDQYEVIYKPDYDNTPLPDTEENTFDGDEEDTDKPVKPHFYA